jgi:hypothetical protein
MQSPLQESATGIMNGSGPTGGNSTVRFWSWHSWADIYRTTARPGGSSYNAVSDAVGHSKITNCRRRCDQSSGLTGLFVLMGTASGLRTSCYGRPFTANRSLSMRSSAARPTVLRRSSVVCVVRGESECGGWAWSYRQASDGEGFDMESGSTLGRLHALIIPQSVSFRRRNQGVSVSMSIDLAGAHRSRCLGTGTRRRDSICSRPIPNRKCRCKYSR